MKILTSFICSLLLFSCSVGSKGQYRPNNDVGKGGLNGHVKYIKETEFNVDEKTGKKGEPELSSETKFNTEGNCIESTTSYYREHTRFRYVYRYNNSGKVTEGLVFHMTGDSTGLKYTFDANGQHTGWVEYFDGKPMGKTTLVCDSRGNVLSERHFNTLGELTGSEVSHYDDSDNVIADSCFKQDTIYSITFSQYDKYHNKLKENTVNPSRKGYLFEDVNKYDEAGNQTEHTNSCNNKVLFKNTFTYEHFDAAKNWLLKHETQDGVPTTVTERVIEYW